MPGRAASGADGGDDDLLETLSGDVVDRTGHGQLAEGLVAIPAGLRAGVRLRAGALQDDPRLLDGATIGRLDDDVLFYLRARGIGLEEARDLLVGAFANEVIARVLAEALRASYQALVGGRLAALAATGVSDRRNP